MKACDNNVKIRSYEFKVIQRMRINLAGSHVLMTIQAQKLLPRPCRFSQLLPYLVLPLCDWSFRIVGGAMRAGYLINDGLFDFLSSQPIDVLILHYYAINDHYHTSFFLMAISLLTELVMPLMGLKSGFSLARGYSGRISLVEA